MSLNALEQLASRGFQAVPPDQFPRVAAECRALGESGGDAGYVLIAEALERASSYFYEEFNDQPLVATSFAKRLEEILQPGIATFLEQGSAPERSSWAGAVRRSVLDLGVEAGDLLHPSWEQ